MDVYKFGELVNDSLTAWESEDIYGVPGVEFTLKLTLSDKEADAMYTHLRMVLP